MFGSAKPAASLSSGLLARKGQARPAMRPQGYIGLDPGTSLDDLGWNDMGGEVPAPAPAPVFEPVPPVLAQRQTLVEEFAPPPLPPQPAPEPVAAPVARAPEPEAPVRPVSTATAARIGREVGARKGKAAFTLRLDHDRHLKLRLASAVTGRSAQVIVTEALDAYLESLPELGALVDRLPAGKAR